VSDHKPSIQGVKQSSAPPPDHPNILRSRQRRATFRRGCSRFFVRASRDGTFTMTVRTDLYYGLFRWERTASGQTQLSHIPRPRPRFPIPKAGGCCASRRSTPRRKGSVLSGLRGDRARRLCLVCAGSATRLRVSELRAFGVAEGGVGEDAGRRGVSCRNVAAPDKRAYRRTNDRESHN